MVILCLETHFGVGKGIWKEKSHLTIKWWLCNNRFVNILGLSRLFFCTFYKNMMVNVSTEWNVFCFSLWQDKKWHVAEIYSAVLTRYVYIYFVCFDWARFQLVIISRWNIKTFYPLVIFWNFTLPLIYFSEIVIKTLVFLQILLQEIHCYLFARAMS